MRCAIVSDIHANWDALEAVLADAGDIDQTWCLGDIVDLGPQPNECLEALRAREAICIFGNHEEWVSGNLPPRLRGSPLEAWARWTNERLTPANVTFLEALPEHVTNGDFTLLHYPHDGFDPPGIDDFVRFASRYCLVGHTHLPLVCRYTTGSGPVSVQISRPSPGETMLLDAERAILNVGSVGSCFFDPSLACYLLVDEPARVGPPTVTFRAVPYPVQSFIEKLHSCGLPSELAADRQRLFHEPPAVAERILAIYREWYPDGVVVDTKGAYR